MSVGVLFARFLLNGTIVPERTSDILVYLHIWVSPKFILLSYKLSTGREVKNGENDIYT